MIPLGRECRSQKLFVGLSKHALSVSFKYSLNLKDWIIAYSFFTMETTTLGLSLDSSTVVVIRTYNEKSNVTQIMQEILKILPLANILIVDDNSEDGTAAVVRELAANEGRLSLICRPRKMGIGTAYIAGFKWGLSRKFEYFVQMDADLSHDPQVLPVLLKNLGDADFVIGSRWIKGGKILG